MSLFALLRPLGRNLFVGAFLYFLVAALTVQKILLPLCFPAIHWGHGLLLGNDSTVVHRIAVENSAKIAELGWSVWFPARAGRPMEGITAALYAFIVPEPWVVAPLQAALQAGGAFFLFQIAQLLLRDRRKSLLAISPIFLLPSAMNWYTQLLKDGFCVLGYIAFAFGWARLYESVPKLANRRGWLEGVGGILLGVLALWVSRPYVLPLLQALSLLFLGGLLFAWLPDRIWQKETKALVLLLAGFVLCWTAVRQLPQPIEMAATVPDAFESTEGRGPYQWRETPGVPAPLERLLHAIGRSRRGYVYQGRNAAASVDTEVEFRSARDIVDYLGRALQIAIFAPFPNQWSSSQASPASPFLRRVAAFETMFLYFTLLFVPVAIYRWRKLMILWVTLTVSLTAALAQSLIVINIGTLYRVRYPLSLLLMMIGLCGLMTILERRSSTVPNIP